jgi:ankyrin repeat protein
VLISAGRTPLFEAAKNGHVEAIKRLLVSGADPLIRIPEERCVTPIPIDLADSEGCTALHYAARFGRAEVIQMLLDNGCDKSLKTKTPHGCATALDFACMNGHIESVRVRIFPSNRFPPLSLE